MRRRGGAGDLAEAAALVAGAGIDMTGDAYSQGLPEANARGSIRNSAGL
ncbi:MAG: hypothetical protein ACREDA_11765 [Methylocella sp.]